MRIAIVGAGVGGLTAAIFLRQAGLAVDVYEQAPELTAVGAGLRLSPNGVRLLQRAGLGPDLESLGVLPDYAWDLRRWRHGEVIWRSPAPLGRDAAHLLIHRADLLDVLLRHLPGEAPRLGMRLQHLDVPRSGSSEPTCLTFADGQERHADIVIGADGIHSLIAKQFMDSRPPLSSGYSAFRGTSPMEGTSFTDLPSAATLWFGPEKHFVAYPVRSRELMNFVGVAPAAASDRESWSAAGDPDELIETFEGWDPRVLELVSHAIDVKRWALMHRAPLERYVQGPVAVIGDAAHPMLPHLSQGACQAIEDSASLAAFLGHARSYEEAVVALAHYDQARRPRATKIQLMSQSQGDAYHLPDGPEQEARDVRLSTHGIPEQAWIYDHDAGNPVLEV